MKGSLLVAGTTSDAGKSVITTGICRLLARRGVSVAPYKAQNMSNNSMVVVDADGTTGEIGRAQWVQALAAKAKPETAMNPILLKPGSDSTSHIVVRGQPAGTIASNQFVGGRAALAKAAFDALDELTVSFDVVVAEGAGSPTEINLRSGDFINMGLARHANMPVLVVGDIDRGGVYAHLFGTLALLSPEDQALIAGFLINQFRGDETLLAPANTALQRITGRPIVGVVPWDPSVWLDSEDGMDVAARRATVENPIKVAVLRLPRISNFTDVDALGLEPDVDVRFVHQPRDLDDADMVVVPGTRATLADLEWVRTRGLDVALKRYAVSGRPLLGVCGGCQMLGERISDPEGIEGMPGATARGFGLLDLTTEFGREKVLRLHDPAYEIHHGRISVGDAAEPWLGGGRQGNVFGTMRHGGLEDDALRSELLAYARPGRKLSGVSFAAAREDRLEHLADLLETHSDVAAILRMIEHGAPSDLPVLPPAGIGN